MEQQVEGKMTTEELLKPRYKVIADFWESPFNINEILNFHLTRGNEYWLDHTTNDQKGISTNSYHINNFDKYPHLFKKLEWWEERKESDMPEYVKNMSNVPEVRKVIEFRLDRLYEVSVTLEKEFGGYDRQYLFIHDTLPATKEEYENQNKK